MTEKEIQNHLYRFYAHKNHFIMIPNAVMRWGEVDFLSVTRAGYVYDFEIKITRADFRADFKAKTDKHARLLKAKDTHRLPNYFFYVVPFGLIPIEQIPSYAGLLYYHEKKRLYYDKFEVVRNAPRLHKQTISAEQSAYIAHKSTERFWSLRLR